MPGCTDEVITLLRPSARLVVSTAVILLALAGCGSDPGASPTTTRPGEALRGLLDDAAPAVDEARAGSPGATTTTARLPAGDTAAGFEHSAASLAVLGDDPDLDAKALDCFQADLTACDDLYVGSPDGSLYEIYGATCGARVDAPTNRLCVDVLLPPAEDPGGLGGDDFLGALADQCFAGDLLDCDILYAQADTGSQYEAYGGSCGRRIETTDDCTEALL